MSARGRPLGAWLRVVALSMCAAAVVAACGETVTQVTTADVAEVRVSPDSLLVATGSSGQLRALPLDSTGALLVAESVTWSSSDAAIASVDDEGLVTGLAEGTTVVTATIASHSDSAVVVVQPAPAIVLSADSVGFTAVAGGGDPAPDSIDITNGGGFTLEGLVVDSITYGAGATGWLTGALSATTAPATVELAAAPAGAGVTAVGTYTATLWLSAPGADGSPATVTATLTITPGAAAQLAVSGGNGQSAEVNTAVTVAPSVLVTDAFGNPVPGVSVTFAPTAGGGSVTGATATSDASGVATVGSWTLGTAVGANTLTATSAGLTPVDIDATAVAAAATQIVGVAGDGQSAVAGSAVSVAPQVSALDAFGNPVAGVSVTFTVTAGAGSITGGTQTTDVDGLAAVGSWTLGAAAGTNTLVATSAAVPDTATFTATGISGAAVAIEFVDGDAQTDTVGATLPTAYAVRVVDNNGNGVAGVTVSWSATAGGGSIDATSDTDANGVATATRVLGTAVGTHTAEGGVGGLTGSPVGFSATATAGNPATVMLLAGDGQSATVGTSVAVAPSVSVTDGFGNPIVGHDVTFAVTGGGGVVDPTTTLQTAADGTATVTSWTLGTTAGTETDSLQATAAGAGLTGNPAEFVASADADVPASITATAGDGQTAITEQFVSTAPVVEVTDQYGNPIVGVDVDFTASGSGAVGTASVSTGATGLASTSWRVSVTGHTMQTADGTFPNTLTATVQGTAVSTQLSGDAVYSWATHVNAVWGPGGSGCTNCHDSFGAPVGGLVLDGSAAQNYTSLVNATVGCDDPNPPTLSSTYRRISPLGGDSAANIYSVLLRLTNPALSSPDTDCSHGAKLGATDVSIVEAWVRNGAPNN